MDDEWYDVEPAVDPIDVDGFTVDAPLYDGKIVDDASWEGDDGNVVDVSYEWSYDGYTVDDPPYEDGNTVEYPS